MSRLRGQGNAEGAQVFVVLYRTGGAGSRLRKYTIGPYGRVTLNQARVTAQKVFAAKLDGRDLAAEKKDSRRRMVTDRVEDLGRPVRHARFPNRVTADVLQYLDLDDTRPAAMD